jgi:hypothetical protein
MSEVEEPEFEEPELNTSTDQSHTFTVVERLIMVGLVIWLAWAGWGYLKREGWIGQTRITSVFMDGNWLTGEYRDCQTDGYVSYLSCPKPNESESAFATKGESSRSFSVDFYGNVAGNPGDTLKWQCKREIDSISCHAAR